MMFSEYEGSLETFLYNKASELAEKFIAESNTYEDALYELKQQHPVGISDIGQALYDETFDCIKTKALRQSTK